MCLVISKILSFEELLGKGFKVGYKLIDHQVVVAALAYLWVLFLQRLL
jgi:hypothetical protein